MREKAFADGFGFVSVISDSVRIRIIDNKNPDFVAYSELFTIKGEASIKSVPQLPLTAINVKIKLEPSGLIISNATGGPTQVLVFDISGKAMGDFQIDKGVNSRFEFNRKLANGTYILFYKNPSHCSITREVLKN